MKKHKVSKRRFSRKVSNRKSLNFDKSYREKYRKGEIEYSCENCANPACDGREPFTERGAQHCSDYSINSYDDENSELDFSDNKKQKISLRS